MRRAIFIPEKVKEDMREHIDAAVKRAVDGYLSGVEDEDTLTGDLGGCLRMRSQAVRVYDDREREEEWKWSINYTKFRGRGPQATEKQVGADAVFELVVNRGAHEVRKSVLFQAKIAWSSDKELVRQVIKMSTWREAAFVLNYTPTQFEVFRLDDVLTSRGLRRNAKAPTPLATFLGQAFLNCDAGDADLRYDASRRHLIWHTMNGEVVAAKFVIGSRLRMKIEVRDAGVVPIVGVDRIVLPAQLHDHRMSVEDAEMLGVNADTSPSDLANIKKDLSLAYHPDTHSPLGELDKAILNRRMQEFNSRIDAIKKHRHTKKE